MSWSLNLENGDFTVGGAQYGTVVNELKLMQDLRCALLQPMGTDPVHPAYGSLIDGGTLPDGTVVPGVIGQPNVNASWLKVEAEIQRICLNYQTQQLNRAKNDRLTYNRVTLTPPEVLTRISDMKLTQSGDQLLVQVILQTARGQTITFITPIALT